MNDVRIGIIKLVLVHHVLMIILYLMENALINLVLQDKLELDQQGQQALKIHFAFSQTLMVVARYAHSDQFLSIANVKQLAIYVKNGIKHLVNVHHVTLAII